MTDSPLLLALETSTATGSVAVGSASGILSEFSVEGQRRHSSELLPLVDGVIRAAGAARSALGGVIVGEGPGSFTGLRIAGATAKGIARALDLPLVAVSSLLAAAAGCWSHPGVVWALFDARGQDVFAAGYRFGATSIETVQAPEALTVGEVARRARGTDPLFTGDGALRHAGILAAAGGRAAPAHFISPRASSLIWIAARYPVCGRDASRSGWEPSYLRPSGAERIAAARAGEGAGRIGG